MNRLASSLRFYSRPPVELLGLDAPDNEVIRTQAAILRRARRQGCERIQTFERNVIPRETVGGAGRVHLHQTRCGVDEGENIRLDEAGHAIRIGGVEERDKARSSAGGEAAGTTQLSDHIRQAAGGALRRYGLQPEERGFETRFAGY